MPLAPVTKKPRCDIGYAAVAVVFACQLAHKIAEDINEPAVRIVGAPASAVFVIVLFFIPISQMNCGTAFSPIPDPG